MIIKDTAKTILCFGDSNTWGAVPNSYNRYPRSVRFTSVLQSLLGEDYEVISEGLPGRTFSAFEASKLHRAGITHIQAILESADPVELVIIMLGTNDVKNTFNLSPEEIGEHLEKTILLIKGNQTLEKIPKILVICPPAVVKPDGSELDKRMVRGLELFELLPDLYEKISKKHECSFLNAGDYISSSKIDGYHLDADSHLKLAKVLKQKVIEML